jgi:hypothetical protein
MRRVPEEYKKFDDAMSRLLTVSHDELKSKLDAEKAHKKKRKPKASASDRVSSDKD